MTPLFTTSTGTELYLISDDFLSKREELWQLWQRRRLTVVSVAPLNKEVAFTFRVNRGTMLAGRDYLEEDNSNPLAGVRIMGDVMSVSFDKNDCRTSALGLDCEWSRWCGDIRCWEWRGLPSPFSLHTLVSYLWGCKMCIVLVLEGRKGNNLCNNPEHRGFK